MGAKGENVTIFLAFEDEELCRFMQKYLARKNCVAYCFGCEGKLAKALAQTPPSILIIDDNFGFRTTVELINWLRDCVASNTAIVFLNDAPPVDNRHHALLASMPNSVAIPMPFTGDELWGAIQQLINAMSSHV